MSPFSAGYVLPSEIFCPTNNLSWRTHPICAFNLVFNFKPGRQAAKRETRNGGVDFWLNSERLVATKKQQVFFFFGGGGGQGLKIRIITVGVFFTTKKGLPKCNPIITSASNIYRWNMISSASKICSVEDVFDVFSFAPEVLFFLHEVLFTIETKKHRIY